MVSTKSHQIFAFSLLLHSYSYYSESPYLVNPVKWKGAVGLIECWLVGKLGLVGCMNDEWHLRRIERGWDGKKRVRGNGMERDRSE